MGVMEGHVLPRLCFHIFLPHCSSTYRIRNRTVGGLTGSRIAVCLGRIPVEDTLASCAPSLVNRSFGGVITICSWVDDLISFGKSTAGAVSMLEEVEVVFVSRWGQSFKLSSLEYMPVFGSLDDEVQPRWRRVSTMRVLGHLLRCNGAIEPYFKSTLSSTWRVF